MYLATLFVTLDLEPEVVQQDRERVLRALRDRLKQGFGSRITVRTDDDAALAIAFFDDVFERIKSRIQDILENIEGASQARISDSHSQIFSWFDGNFQETKDSLDLTHGEKVPTSLHPPMATNKTIRYNHDEDDDFSPLPSRLSRRNLRIPTRK